MTRRDPEAPRGGGLVFVLLSLLAQVIAFTAWRGTSARALPIAAVLAGGTALFGVGLFIVLTRRRRIAGVLTMLGGVVVNLAAFERSAALIVAGVAVTSAWAATLFVLTRERA